MHWYLYQCIDIYLSIHWYVMVGYQCIDFDKGWVINALMCDVLNSCQLSMHWYLMLNLWVIINALISLSMHWYIFINALICDGWLSMHWFRHGVIINALIYLSMHWYLSINIENDYQYIDIRAYIDNIISIHWFSYQCIDIGYQCGTYF